jgi:hypothetical protein
MKKKSPKKIVSIRRAKNTLRRVFVPFFRKFTSSTQEKVPMLLPNVRKVMTGLREKSRLVRTNNKKIDDWVDNYINRQALEGKPITLLTQWCLAKDLENRFLVEAGFYPTEAEKNLFEKELPQIARLFQSNGIALKWTLTFNRSYLDLGRISPQIEKEYVGMIKDLASSLIKEGWLEVLNWEDDILDARAEPDEEVYERIRDFVADGALRLDIERHRPWVKEVGLKQTETELERDVCFKIACEVREGCMLIDPEWYFGECIIVPLESPERYDFFGIKALGIKDRVAAVLQPYPWRKD